jgi:energy-coupling factor transporter ATP-binding protein EcfA2
MLLAEDACMAALLGGNYGDMKVYSLRIANFRGFELLEIKPRGHVLLVGEPGAGRSDLVEALWRLLSAESTRFPLPDDLDFFNRDLTRRIEIEGVLGELGPYLEQAFLDRLELWDPETSQLVEELSPASEANYNSLQYVVRLCYRAVWESDQQQARQWVDFPKFSDPEAQDYKNAPRALREELPVSFVASKGSPLSLGARGDLRRLVDSRTATDFASALDQLREGINQLAAGLVGSKDLTGVVSDILEPLRIPLGLGDRAAGDIVQFAPEGGSLAGIIRSLQPMLKLREELGFLPLARHGSTIAALLQLCQGAARADGSNAVVVVDDFGEDIDIDMAQHLASFLRARVAQLWVSTRRGAVGQHFRPQEMIRLTVSRGSIRRAYAGKTPRDKAERLAARHLHLQILPAISSRSVVIVEGPHERVVLTATAAKLNAEEGVSLPATHRIAILDAGAAEGSGGITAIPRLARLARDLGFHVIALIDWDHDRKAAKERLDRNLEATDVVIRWPQGFGIERALLQGLDDNVVRAAVTDMAEALSLPLDFDPGVLSADDLADRVAKLLKSSGGLHGPFVDALPEGDTPPLLRRCFEEIRQAITRTGLVQL